MSSECRCALAMHFSDCPLYKTEKKPRLFYFEEAVGAGGAYIQVPADVSSIIETDQLDDGEVREITFKRIDLTDEQLENLPEE